MCCKDPKSSSPLLTLQTSPPRQEEDQKPIFEEGRGCNEARRCEIKKDSHQQIDKFKNYSLSSFYASLLNNKSKKKSPNTSLGKSKRNSSGRASNMFCNIITCDGVDTVDSVLESIKCDNKASSKRAIIKNDNRSSGRGLNQERQKSWRSFESKKQQRNGLGESKVVSAAYKPVGGPTCSQCGKIFKPEKMHSHMKSCRGMKAFAKTTAETK